MYKQAKDILNIIKTHDKIAIFNHVNIDGDSYSSSYGLALALKKAFPEKHIKWVTNIEEVKHNFPFLNPDESFLIDNIDETYLAIIGDTSVEERIEKFNELKKVKNVVVFDHHKMGMAVKNNYFWHEPDWPASALQAIAIAEAANVEFDEEIAFALMIGLLTDTGNFTYSLANPHPVLKYGLLLKYISNEKMNKFWNAFRARTKRDVEVSKMFLNALVYKGGVAYVYITEKDKEKYSDVNFKRQIGHIANITNYPIWCFFVEEKIDNVSMIKLHFRSNGPDVASVAMFYGGNGHTRAAGARVRSTEGIIDKVLKKLNDIIEK